jgi:hypothetical protein
MRWVVRRVNGLAERWEVSREWRTAVESVALKVVLRVALTAARTVEMMAA